ncbi:leucyl aminopeptidase family protein [Nocardioides sp. ChNu-99]|uniref:leucyl aminopeptidase family protein n=1 Tax=Nocardioides sp. ChNu-99 TaxID=2839897 RepID=UPI00240752C3|nr:leucyl aminopeptidase family protein [Nocardioides sp. ChNu-99]
MPSPLTGLPLDGLPSQPEPPTVLVAAALADAWDDAPADGPTEHDAPRTGTTIVVPVLRGEPGESTASGDADGDAEGDADAATDDDAAGPVVGPGGPEVADRWSLDLLAQLDAHGATGAAGEITRVPLLDPSDEDAVPRLLLLVGIGAGSPADLRRAGAAVARACRGRDRVVSTVAAATDDDHAVAAHVAGLTLGSFSFTWGASAPTSTPVGTVVLAGLPDALVPVVDRAAAVARAAWLARLLATVPSNVKSPAWLAAQARGLAEAQGLEVEVVEGPELERRGFGGIAAVGRASATPPCLVRLDYVPAGTSRAAARRLPRVVLVGKGITFDSGGLSLKPAEGMRTMKRDMTGGGVVIATLAALAAVDCPVRVTGLVAAAENAVGGDALRPGDVLRHYGGRTTEVTNTDAEGRLVLADALAYAVDELDPAILVDIATLTGAGKVALGQRTGGLFATSDALAEGLLATGRAVGEPLWRLPLADVYEEKLASTVADADNAPGGPGAITAALFLRHFTGGRPWAHLDIASVGDAAGDAHEWTAGPTGFGARLLLDWLAGLDPAALPR